MQIKIFTVPLFGNDDALEEMNSEKKEKTRLNPYLCGSNQQNSPMMKKLILICFLSLCAMLAKSQDFEIVGVEHLPNDFAPREEMKTDHSERQCALLRIATQKITPEQRELFTFKPDLGSELVERATRNGEIWLWVSPGLKYLRVMHRDWGQYELKLMDHVSRVESLHTYKIVIKGPEFGSGTDPKDNKPQQQYLAFQITPPNAFLEVDGKPVKVNPDGSASKYVDFGVHTYSVRATDYFPKEGNVTVDDSDNTVVVKLALDPDFAKVTLKVDADAEIWVNNERKGVRTWTGVLGSDLYKIECKQANHETSEMSLEISADMAGRTFTLPVPKPIYGSLNVESTPDFATIYIDGEEAGKTPKSVREILIGQHEIRLTKNGYADHTETVTITKGEPKQVTATLSNMDYERIAKKGDEYYDAKNYEEALKCYREAAEHGNAVGQNGMGRLCSGGFAVQQDDAEAARWYRLAAEQGLDAAQFNLGVMYEFGSGDLQDYAEAARWYRLAAEQGLNMAQVRLGYCYYYGLGVDRDFMEAFKCFQKPAKQGMALAQYELGKMYYLGLGVTLDKAEGNKWITKAAEQGDADLQCSIGSFYSHRDEERALKWYLKSAEQGNSQAQWFLGVAYETGEGVAQNGSEAVKWFVASEQEQPTSSLRLGDMYYDGRAVAKDYSEAKKWYLRYLEKKNPIYITDVAFKLGRMHYLGTNGLVQNYSEAVKWYRTAAEKGSSAAQCNLGYMYDKGYGVTEDDVEAVKWYRKAADQGDATAQYNLGVSYEYGEGVKKSKREAKKWYKLAADQGYQNAIDALKKLK